MKNVDSSPVTLIKCLQYRPSPGKFPTNLEYSQETFFLEWFFVKLEIRNSGTVTLEKRDCFAKVFLKMLKL